MAHPSLPSLRAQLSVPRLRFFISAARVRRVMRVLRSALPGQLPICAGCMRLPCTCCPLRCWIPRSPCNGAGALILSCLLTLLVQRYRASLCLCMSCKSKGRPPSQVE